MSEDYNKRQTNVDSIFTLIVKKIYDVQRKVDTQAVTSEAIEASGPSGPIFLLKAQEKNLGLCPHFI